MFKDIKVIGFDADDTLWVNEPFFRESEQAFFNILKNFAPADYINKELFRIEMQNLSMYGYGAKSFMLSMIETALLVSKNKVTNTQIEKIIKLGKEQIEKPVELLDNIEKVLIELSKDFKLILATKGDLLDQERKLEKSGLSSYFHHIEVMSDKKPENYRKLIKHLDINPQDFLMIGNSLKSDVIPVLEIGGKGVHIPFHTTWIHEEVEDFSCESKNCKKVESINEVLDLIK